MANQPSKTMSTRSSVFAVAFFLICAIHAIAGSGSGGGTQVGPTDNASVSTYKATDTSVGASARDSASASTGASTSQSSAASGSSSSSSSSSVDGSSSNGSGSSYRDASSAFGASPRGTNNATQIATELAREKVVDTGDKAVETAKAAKVESTDKTFAPGLLDKVSNISAVSAQKEGASAPKSDENKAAASKDKNDSH
jgi:hypothetical protein